MAKKRVGLLLIWIVIFNISLHAQWVHKDIVRELAITQQLLGKDSDSFLYPTKPIFQKKKINIELLPIGMTNLYHSALPTGYNLGSAIAAKGYQLQVSGGFKANIGDKLKLQINPEWVEAKNQSFEQMSQILGDQTWADYYRFANNIDLPTKMGEGLYSRAFLGQSYIKYQLNKNWEAGISSENLWWGPGWKNALIMSYNAPGFLHATVNTKKPVDTKWGTISFQWIGGKIKESGVLPLRINSVYNGNFVYQPKPQEDRILSAIHFNWTPKWTPNLTLGYSGAAYFYANDWGTKASLGALYARYRMPEDLAELYMEFGALKDFRRAYVAGFRKLFPTKNGAHIQFATELTQMQAQTAELIRNPNSWYTSDKVRHGYTHLGRTIGAGIGPGSNSQNIEIAWVKNNNKIGFQFERLRHNSDFYYFTFERIGDFRRHWIDLSSSAFASWQFKHIWLNARVQWMRTFNYQWLIIETSPSTPANYFDPGNDYRNISASLSAILRL